MYEANIDHPAYIVLNAVAADVSEFFFDADCKIKVIVLPIGLPKTSILN